MAVSVATRILEIGTGAATTTYSISGLSFAPVAIIGMTTGHSSATDNINAALNIRQVIGFATGTTDRHCVSVQADDAAATSATDQITSSDSFISILSIAGAVDGALDIQSFDSGGVTFVVDTQFSATTQVIVFLIGGADITNATTFNMTATAATGTQDNTSIGFEGDVLFIASCASTALNTATTSAPMSFGVAVSSNEQAVISTRSADNNPAAITNRYCYQNDECLAVINAADTVSWRWGFDSWLSNGFRLNRTEGTSAIIIIGLVIKGGSWTIKPFATRTDGNDIAVTGAGFTPKGGLVFSTGETAESTQDTAAAHWLISMGAFDSTSSRAAMLASLADDRDPVDAVVAIETDAVYINEDVTAAGGAVVGLMDIKSLDSDGVTFVMDDTDPASNFGWTLLVGDTASSDLVVDAAAFPVITDFGSSVSSGNDDSSGGSNNGSLIDIVSIINIIRIRN